MHNDTMQNRFNLKQHIREIPDFPEPGILFYDISTLIKQPDAWTQVIEDLSDILVRAKINMVYGIEARGFLVAAAVAHHLNIGMQMIRKKGKLPGKVLRQKYSLEYGNDEIQIHIKSITSRDRVLIIDDLIATGGTAVASAKLISKCKVKNIEFYFIIDLKNVGGSQKLGKKFKLSSILEAEG